MVIDLYKLLTFILKWFLFHLNWSRWSLEYLIQLFLFLKSLKRNAALKGNYKGSLRCSHKIFSSLLNNDNQAHVSLSYYGLKLRHGILTELEVVVFRLFEVPIAGQWHWCQKWYDCWSESLFREFCHLDYKLCNFLNICSRGIKVKVLWKILNRKASV